MSPLATPARHPGVVSYAGGVTLRGKGPRSSGLAALLVADRAEAFCRTTTSQVPAGYDPSTNGCWSQGKPLAWQVDSVPYGLQRAASKQVSLADATKVAHASFMAWNDVVCPGGPTRIEAFDNGPLTTQPGAGGCTNSNSCDPAQDDVIVFDDTVWPHDDPYNTLALTTVTYGVDDGRIFEAYTEVNSTKQLTVQEPPPASSPAYDLQAILTHEAGHFLGLAHAADSQSVMYALYSRGRIELTPDDVAGLCAIYPPAPQGCACSTPPGSAGRPSLLFALAAGAIVYARRTRFLKKTSTDIRSSV